MICLFGSVTECMPSLSGVFMPDVSLHHAIVHVVLLRKTYRPAAQTLDVRPEIQVLTLDFLRLLFSDRVLLWWYVFFVRLPPGRRAVVCVIMLYVQMRQLAHQLLARGVVALADLEGQYLAASPAVGVPEPALARLSLADPRPHLVDHHALVATRKIRLGVGLEPQPQDYDHRHCTHFQHPGCIPDATTVHGHLADPALKERVGTGVSVRKLELPVAVLAIEILLAVGLEAILLYIWRGAVRAVNFDQNVRHSAKLGRSCAFL